MTVGVSTISWLDIDDDQTRRIQAAIAALDDRETLDPIGTGTIRDAFSEALFPGTSTIQTRLRYFLFVPWTCQAVAARRPGRTTFQDRLREQELRLIEALRPIGPNQGVIGYRARRNLARMPSSVYWHGLGAWGVRTRPEVTLAQYANLATRPGGADRTIRDDGGDVLGGSPPFWDPGLPEPPAEFPGTGLTMGLTEPEAHYLRDRLRSTRMPGAHPAGDPSMLACLAEGAASWQDSEDPWSDERTDSLPEAVARVLTHARHFSEIVFGAQLLYNVLLAERAAKVLHVDTTKLVNVLNGQLDHWFERVTKHTDAFTDWWARPEEFWATVSECGGRVRPGTRDLLQHWIGAAVLDPRAAFDDASSRSRIREQELALKGRYARLTHQTALQSWDGGSIGAAPLRYRWQTVRNLMSDLHLGLVGAEAADAPA
ncbi:DUF6361 family protein [Micromonospora sp. NBC_01699]|uniref:DUF6361 family protein n=1 Tax=Micromonospora sp. NBC_01699 TaxID=2975984 RepID=UPI002E369DAA|nr:DUF6361 family protein [Micromonospora sp. NBC_01699]